jgi:hypothetical protein
MTDVLADIVRANLAASLAILGVLVLRLPVRRHLGAQSAYALWLMAPLAFLASLVPAAEAQTAEDAAAAAAQLNALLPLPLQALRTLSHIPTLTEVWIVGLALAIALVAAGQLRFLHRARAGLAGPALVGVICPRMVTPKGYDTLFTEAERALVRAHERAHIDRGDPKVNALIALAQCLCWFNPLVHLAAHLARLDQELACDATVMYRRPGARRLYPAHQLGPAARLPLAPRRPPSPRGPNRHAEAVQRRLLAPAGRRLGRGGPGPRRGLRRLGGPAPGEAASDLRVEDLRPRHPARRRAGRGDDPPEPLADRRPALAAAELNRAALKRSFAPEPIAPAPESR